MIVVDVRTVRLDADPTHLATAAALLSPDESDRAARFRFERHRMRFTLARSALRIFLGRLLNCDPKCVQFQYGPKGKPDLAGGLSPVSFNASNSGDLAAYAFTTACPIGIDIEHIRPMPDLHDVARHFFSSDEVTDLMNLPDDERPAGFFRCWTRKEAYIKAVGDGLSLPLDSFRVTLLPSDPPRIVHLRGSGDSAANWSLHAFTPAPGYFGAFAYPDHPRPIQFNPPETVQEMLDSL